MEKRKSVFAKAIILAVFGCVLQFLPFFTDTAWAKDFGIWIGNEQFTDQKTRIDGLAGYAKFIPESGEIYFSNFRGVKELYHNPDDGGVYQIYLAGCEGMNTITLSGKLTLNEKDASGEQKAFYANACALGAASFVKTVRFAEGSEIGITSFGYGIYAKDSRIEINGESAVTGEHTCAILAKELILCENGRLISYISYETVGEKVTTVQCEEVVIDGGELFTMSNGDGSISVLTDRFTVLDGEGGIYAVGDAAEAIKGEVTICGGKTEALAEGDGAIGIHHDNLWVYGGELNAGATGIAIQAGVSLYDGILRVMGSGDGSIATYGNLYIEGGAMEVYVEKKTRQDAYAIVANADGESLYVSAGTLSVEASGNGILCGGLEVAGGMVLVDAQGEKGICSTDNIEIQTGGINAKGTAYGIYSEKRILCNGGKTQAQGNTAAMYAKGNKGISLSPNAKIDLPKGGETYTPDTDDTYTTITESGSTQSAKSVVITGSGEYNVYVGGYKVTEANQKDIPGVAGENAHVSYDNITHTLTFSGDSASVTTSGPGGAIYSMNGLTIAGDVKISSDSWGIHAGGNHLIIKGNVQIQAKGEAIAAKTLSIPGTVLAYSAESCGVWAQKRMDVAGSLAAKSEVMSGVMVQDEPSYARITGSVIAEGATYGIEAYGDLDIKSNLNAKGKKDGVFVPGKLRILDGNVVMEGETCAVFAKKRIEIAEKMKVTEPDPWSLNTDGNSILDAKTGKEAGKVQLRPRRLYTVRFDSGGFVRMIERAVSEDKTLKRPEDPTAVCRTFTGWYSDSTCKTAYDFSEVVRKDMTLYAGWDVHHTLHKVEGVKATADRAGNIPYYSCEICGCYFSDAEGLHEIKKDSVLIPAKGRNVEEPGKQEDPYGILPDISEITDDSLLKKKDQLSDRKTGAIYEITDLGNQASVTYVSNTKDQSEVVVPDTVTIGKKKFRVTQIAANAFKNCKKLRKFTIGKYIQKIGKNAFFGCRNLKTIKFKTTLLSKKRVDKNAFKGIHKKAKCKVPKKKRKAYRKMLKARGVTGKQQKIL